jgi:acetylglutamate kinase
VLDARGRTIARLSLGEAGRLISDGTANKGMVAKLQACRSALEAGVADVVVADGRKARLGMLADSAARLSACTLVVK